MRRRDLIEQIARSDSSFRLVDGEWIGRCLICNAPLRFTAADGGGATVEHIVPRREGGSDELANLALVHAACNWEKGVHWDEPRRRHGRQHEYEQLLTRLLTRRRARWRDPDDAGNTNGMGR
ncbi:MAG: HNH endonuclease [Chloroflexi bacterium]|nr:MAG: HNH endonuclease [Chloroflexota bacterium]